MFYQVLRCILQRAGLPVIASYPCMTMRQSNIQLDKKDLNSKFLLGAGGTALILRRDGFWSAENCTFTSVSHQYYNRERCHIRQTKQLNQVVSTTIL